MIKLNILNMKNFLKVVNQCVGRIMVASPDGKRTDINGRTGIQHRLQAEYLENGKCLPLTLEFDYPADYFAVVSYHTMPETVKFPA